MPFIESLSLLILPLGVILEIVLAISPAFAQQNTRPSITPMKSTPDMQDQEGVTLDVVFPVFVEYIAIKDECASDLYFSLGGYDFSVTSPTTPDACSSSPSD